MKILIALFLLLPALTFAQQVPQPRTPREKAEALLSSIQSGDINGGYDRFLVEACPAISLSQQLTMLKKQTDAGVSVYGKILGHEFVKEESFGSSVVRLVYLLKSEEYFTVWEFRFYKPKATWLVAGVFFDDQFTRLR